MVSAKVRGIFMRSLRNNIVAGRVSRRAPEEEVRREEEELRKPLEKAGELLSGIPKEEIITAIRSSRSEN